MKIENKLEEIIDSVYYYNPDIFEGFEMVEYILVNQLKLS